MPDHEDRKFEQWLRDAAQAYHTPLPTPREEMWARIEAGRRRRLVVIRPWARWALAAAAMLVLGIGIGRWSAGPAGPAGPSDPAAGAGLATDPGESRALLYHVAATQYLSRTEAFLTGFRADLRDGRVQPRFAGQARDLLSTTRLMLDSPAADDRRLLLLLEDLELVLMQISQLQSGRGSADADLITQGMDNANVLPKLRSAIPAGPAALRVEGAL